MFFTNIFSTSKTKVMSEYPPADEIKFSNIAVTSH